MKQQNLTTTSRALQWTIVALWLLTLGIALLRWTAVNTVAWLPPTLAAQVGSNSVTPGVLYRRFGRGLLLLGTANALYTSLLSALLSMAVQGKLAISVGLSTADLYLLIVGCAVQMLGMVMDEAYRLHDENSQIV